MKKLTLSKELIFIQSSVEASKEEKSEQKLGNSEDRESTNSRRFTDQETLINAMSRPMLPQKAVPMQRSVSCNSLVQTIKDLGFSVWNKPDKKRNSDGLYLPKKSSKSSSPVSSGKAISPKKTITLISFTTKEDSQNGKNDASSTDKKRDLFQYPWYHEVNSKEATNRLLGVGENGAYLVRPSTVITDEIKNTLCVLHDWKIRNMYIRKKEDGLYSLGSKKLFEQTFSSIPELVEYHQREPIEIKPFGGSASSQPTIYVLLKTTPSKSAKSLVYADKPQTLDHLEDNIHRVIADIRPQMLEKVIENWTSRLDYIRANRGSPMPEIIFKM
ncbi:SH2 domain-containing protein [Trichonephila clavipes]|nr:SH2 domain-containing protein [Trichonephila clavipes]